MTEARSRSAVPRAEPGEAGEALVWIDGRILPESEATVSVADRGFVFGDGLFETTRTRGRRAFRLGHHLERLRRGARLISTVVPEEVVPAVAGLLAHDRFPQGALRITLTRGVGVEGLRPHVSRGPTLVVSLRRAPPFQPETGLSVHISAVCVSSRSPLAGLKTLGYLPNILALAQSGADDALMLDERGKVAQASAANVFWVGASGELRTPSRECGILPGITRGAVLDLARSIGIPTSEGEWGIDDLLTAQEAFATSSLRGLAPIFKVGERPLGEGHVGTLTRSLQAAYAELFERETA